MWVLEHINKQLDKNKQALATKKCAVKFYRTNFLRQKCAVKFYRTNFLRQKCAVKFYRTNFKAKDKPLPKLISTFF